MSATTKTTKHTAEPWIVDDDACISQPGPDGDVIVTIRYGDLDEDAANAANAARIVACVNACAGIDDPAEAIEQARSTIRRAIWELAPLMAQWATAERKPLADLRSALAALTGKPTP